MKKKFLIKMFSVFFVLALVNSSVTLAKVRQKNVEQTQEEKLSPKEQKEKDIKTIKEVLKKYESLEEQMQKKMFNMFKNFKKEDYEVKNYDLEVFEKANAKFLVYTHKKTGAQVFFSLILDKEKLKQEKDKLIFSTPSKNDSGLTHFSEHCLASPVTAYFTEKIKTGAGELNAYTVETDLSFQSKVSIFGSNKDLEKEFIEKLSKELVSPSALKKGDKTFEIEKKRILNEIKDNKSDNYFLLEMKKILKIRDFNSGGEVLELEKVTLNDFKKFYEKYIHPSNCLLIKNVFELNPKAIKNYLNLWHENYFSHFEKKDVKGTKYEFKVKDKYFLNNWPKDSGFLKVRDKKRNKYKDFKFRANVSFDEDFLKAKQKELFRLSFKPFEKELEKLFKRLGYSEKSDFHGPTINFYGDNKDCFTKKALEENSKKIMDFVIEKLENLKEEDFLYCRYYDFKFYKEPEIKELNFKNKNEFLWSNPINYKGSSLSSLVEDSFLRTKKAISDKNFIIKENNELESSSKLTEKNIKENLKKDSNVYKILAKKGPKYINVFKRDDKKTVKQMFEKEKEKYEVKVRVLPIKFKDEKPKKFVKDFAIILLAKLLDSELKNKRGLIYTSFGPNIHLENNFLVDYELNKTAFKDLEDFVFNSYDEIFKNFSLINSDLNEVKKKFKEKFNLFKKEYENFLKKRDKTVRDFKKYIKTGKIDENSELKKELTIKDMYMFYPIFLIVDADYNLFTAYENFKDYNDFFEKEMAFKEKYEKKFKEKINPEFVKDFLENLLEPAFKKLDKAFKLAEEKLKALDSIKLSDVEALIKTAYLVKDKEEIEKVNKNFYEREKRLENYSEKVNKS